MSANGTGLRGVHALLDGWGQVGQDLGCRAQEAKAACDHHVAVRDGEVRVKRRSGEQAATRAGNGDDR